MYAHDKITTNSIVPVELIRCLW